LPALVSQLNAMLLFGPASRHLRSRIDVIMIPAL
jgi:hypothetical protein